MTVTVMDMRKETIKAKGFKLLLAVFQGTGISCHDDDDNGGGDDDSYSNSM
jgi:hypothetical protein